MNAKDTIRNNFSRYARYYDAYSAVQNHTGSWLAATLRTNSFTKIIDIGCGTGNYTRLLRQKLPQSRLTALDICPRMITLAKNKLRNRDIEFIVADAESTPLGEKFDLVTSNACFQWFADLDAALQKFAHLLDENGVILFSTFGPRTFGRLSSCLGRIFDKKMQINAKNFPKKQKIRKLLQKYYTNIRIKEQLIDQNYSSLLELLNTIKYTGTRGTGLNGQFLTKNRLEKLERIYKENFSEIIATYQIFFCRAQK